MFESATLVTYLAASIAIILAPGPAQALVLARSVNEGAKAGVLTGIGLNVGTIVHAIAAALGLSAVLATSAAAFTIVKFLGAGYLIYLGIQTLRSKTPTDNQAQIMKSSPLQAFRESVITGILNPKVAIFFLAFLPQFVNPARGFVFLQFLVLGSILALLDICYESVLAFAAGSMSDWFMQNPRFTLWRQRIMGVVLVGLGVRLALTERQ
jgi:threonine/homoserine/homoserine lactone efflux protein